MSIHKIGSDLVRPSGPDGTRRGSASSRQADADDLPRIERADRVDISTEGRELAAQLAHRGEGLSAGRSELIRGRIQSGFYNDPSIAEQVAERLVASGTLDIEA